MQKENLFFFSFSSESTFGEAKGTNKRAKCKHFLHSLLQNLVLCETFRTFANMKPAKIFQQYVWLVNTLRQYKRLTLEEINNLWVKNDVIGGSPLNRVSFYRHKDAILNMFGIVIDCEPKTYKYYIANPEVINDDSIERWMLSTLTVSTALSDCTSIRGRIILESAPAGEEFLEPAISAMKKNHRLRMGYHKFHADEGYEKTICPYVLKRFDQRWYLLALNDENQMRIYALDDRMTMLELTDETFEMPHDFSPEDYFAEYFGVYTVDIPLAHVVVRAYDFTPNTCAVCRCTIRSASWHRAMATPTSRSTSVLPTISCMR